MVGTCGYGEGLSGSINAGNFLTSCKVYWLASQEGLCSMELVSKEVDKIERHERKKLYVCSVNGNTCIGDRMKWFINFNRRTVDFS